MNGIDKHHESFGVPDDVLQSLSSESRVVIERLLSFEREPVDLSPYPTSKLAAVLVLLYERNGQIRVLLTTRSKKLRSHPGQTALPGGKCDESDVDILDTAYREANEEVGLPRNSSSIHALCLLRPFMSLYGLLVTPVVALLTDLTLLNSLVPNINEVDAIFEHPVEAVLDPSIAKDMQLVEKGSEHWPYQDDLHNTSDTVWLNETAYRMHRFRSAASPVKGLTSDILTMTAEIAYDRKPVYERWAPGQAKTFADIVRIIKEQETVKQKVFGLVAESKHASREHLPST